MHLCNLKIAKVRFSAFSCPKNFFFVPKKPIFAAKNSAKLKIFAFFLQKIWKNPKVRRIFAVGIALGAPNSKKCGNSDLRPFRGFTETVQRPSNGRPKISVMKFSRFLLRSLRCSMFAFANSRAVFTPQNIHRMFFGTAVSLSRPKAVRSLSYYMLYGISAKIPRYIFAPKASDL